MREIFRKDSLVVGELDLNEIESYIEELAKMRIEAFCEYPYLYAGSIEYELEYLKSYTTCTDICVQILSDNGQICGMITSMPMEHSWDELCGDLDKLGVDSCKYFYVGELIIKKEYRNLGIGKIMLDRVRVKAKSFGFKTLSMATIKGGEFMKPKDYVPFDIVAQKFGFEKVQNAVVEVSWPTLPNAVAQTHTMQIWEMSI